MCAEGHRNDPEPFDCTGCEIQGPELMPENAQAWRLWLAVNSQWRAGGFGVVGLDYPAVYQTADVFGIEVTPGILRKVQALEAFDLKRFADKARDKGGAESGK